MSDKCDVEVRRNHNRSVNEAKELADKFVDTYRDELAVRGEWEESTFTFVAKFSKGRLMVTDGELTLCVDLEFPARLAKGKVKKGIERELDKLLA